MKARADARLLTVLTQLPRLVATAMAISWRADRRRTVIVAAATIAAGVMSAFGLLATQRVLIELFAAGPTPQRITAALPALGWLAAVTALRASMGIINGYAQNGLTPRVNREIERHLFETTTAVRLDAFDQDEFADDMERASRGTDSAIALVQGAFNFLAGLAGLIAVTIAVIVIHPLLLPALLVATTPNAWAAIKAGHQRYQTYVAGSARRRRLWVLQQQMAERRSATELRSYTLRGFLLNLYDRVMGAETAIQLKLARQVTTTTTIGAVIGGLATTAVYVLLGLLLFTGNIPLSAAATCVIAVQAAQRSLSTVTIHIDRIYLEGQHFGDYTGFMHRAQAHMPPDKGAIDPGPLSELAISHVSMSYPDRDTPAVDNVSLTLKAGQTIAFVGENGSGKTTLAAIIAGLRQPGTGTVSWNGHPVSDLDTARWQARIAVVTQDFHRWPFSAATNVAIGDSTATADLPRIYAAARRAAAHDMILDLPFGYDTLLDRTFKDGQELSGGQWQRVTAARGFMREADLLIMDEPSSALDPKAEHALFQAIRDRQGSLTTILITHRLANVRHADVIYVLDRGKLLQSGNHDQLMAAAGAYRTLFTLQAQGYATAKEAA
ncbi:ABC transporter ATP-binding protein [Rhizocola hellebori]|nr:ABC transporter ATP-binding protein [Rhizocola hellebori]